jgi:hypothetical protein
MALIQGKGRLRGRASAGGSLVLVRRGGFMNEFVRAQVDLNPDESGARATVHVSRPRATSVFLTVALPFLFLGPLFQMGELALRHGPSTAAGWLPFLLIGLAIWAAVIGANYTSARSEANDLRRMINEALNGHAESHLAGSRPSP